MFSFRSFGGICETASCPVRELAIRELASYRCLSRRVDNRTGNDGTDDRTGWADIQAIQLLLSTCFLRGWDAKSNCIGEVLVLRRLLIPL